MEIVQPDKSVLCGSEKAGGKVANLLELLRLGIPVPGGMLITTDAYEAHAIRCGLHEQISPGISRLWLTLPYSLVHTFGMLKTDWRSWRNNGPRDFIFAVSEPVDLSAVEDRELLDRDISAQWGRRLADRGILSKEENVGYLTCEEVREWLLGMCPPLEDARTPIARRRATYRIVNGRWQAERFGAVSRGKRLRGVAASPGVVRGQSQDHPWGA